MNIVDLNLTRRGLIEEGRGSEKSTETRSKHSHAKKWNLILEEKKDIERFTQAIGSQR